MKEVSARGCLLLTILALYTTPLLGQIEGKQLLKASTDGDIELVEESLAKGADVNFAAWNKENPLGAASEGGHLEVVKLLLKKGADPNQAGQYGAAPLHRAAFRGHSAVVKHLLKMGAAVNAQNDRGETGFFMGVVIGSVEICRALVDNGADVNLAPSDGFSPLSEACTAGHFDVVQLIVANGGVYEKTPSTEIWLAIVRREPKKLTVLIKGLKVADVIEKGNSLLSWAVMAGDAEMVKTLLEAGADPSYGSPSDYAGEDMWFEVPLHRAAESGALKVAQILLDAGADVSHRSSEGLTALDIAADMGHADLAAFLLKNGAVAETVDDQALLFACENRNKAVIRTLLDHGLRGGPQAFGLVLDPADYEIAMWMIDAELAAMPPKEEPAVAVPGEGGGTVTLGGAGQMSLANGLPAFMYLSIVNLEEKLVKLMLDGGADPDMQLQDETRDLEAFELGMMPLHLAAYVGDKKLVSLLLEYDADVNAAISTVGYAVEDGEEIMVLEPVTALDVAVTENRTELAQFLRDKGAISAKDLK